ncbi:unnamed protein product, partial [Didymodactylos carnosus]
WDVMSPQSCELKAGPRLKLFWFIRVTGIALMIALQHIPWGIRIREARLIIDQMQKHGYKALDVLDRVKINKK